MQRVKDHRYLYRRTAAWVFRRSVPDSVRAAFGTSEVHITLKAATIAEARLATQPHLESFERKLRLAKNGGAIEGTAPSGWQVRRADIPAGGGQ